MKAKTIQEAVRKSPFKPFFLQIDNGAKVKVEHPEWIIFNGRKTECIVAEGRDDFHYLDLDHVSGLAYLQNGHRSRNRTKGK